MIKKPHFESSLALLTVLLMYFSVSIVQDISAQSSTQWALPDGARARLGKGWISDIAISPDGTRLAAAGSLGIWLYDVHTGAEVALLTGHTGGVSSVAFSSDEQMLVSGSWDKTVRLWNPLTGEEFHILSGHSRGITSVSFSHDGSLVASGSSDKTIRIWHAHTGRHVRTLEGHKSGIYSVAFSSTAPRLPAVEVSTTP